MAMFHTYINKYESIKNQEKKSSQIKKIDYILNFGIIKL